MNIVSFLDHLTIRKRLVLLPLPLLLPIFILLYLLVAEQNKAIDFAKAELEGLKAIEPINRANQDFHVQLISGNDSKISIKESVAEQKKVILGTGLITEQDKEMKEWVTTSQATPFNLKNTLDFLSATRAIILKVGDNSNLVLDPDVDTYYLMDATLFRVPDMMIAVARLKIVLIDEMNGDLAKNPKFSDDSLARINISIEQIRNRQKEMRFALRKTIDANESVRESLTKSEQEIIKQGDQYLQDLNSLLLAPVKPSDLNNALAQVQKGALHGKFVQDVAMGHLQALIEHRISNFKNARLSSLLFVCSVLAMSVFFAILVIRSISKPLVKVLGKVEELSSGDADLSAKLPIHGLNEISLISKSINQFLSKLNGIINTLKSSAKDSDKASDLLYNDAISVSDSAQELAATSEEASAALEELTTSFEIMFNSISSETQSIFQIVTEMKNMKNSIGKMETMLVDLDNQAISSFELAKMGNETVHSTDVAMEEINTVTKEISGIVELINEISEQTNLLALNASIEAARAGDAGRGFAVVAEEISKLSDKTKESVKNIKRLVEKSNSVVGNGATHVEETVTVLSKIVEKSDEVQSYVANLKGEMEQQTGSIDRINNELTGLKDMAEMIELSSKEQKKASQDMMTSINTLAGGAQTLAINAEDLKDVSEKLKIVSDSISGIAAEFKTD
ncbi:MAG: methyl-accepting chemotaxis protein [Leptospira sp.]|nr:methyl-accepting chemotaxis protein [Leptospira sp.]